MKLYNCIKCNKKIAKNELTDGTCTICGSILDQEYVNNKSIIGQTVIIENFEIAENDFVSINGKNGLMNWTDSKKYCAKLGKGWRLPTLNELQILYQKRKQISGFHDLHYWSSTVDDNLKSAWSKGFFDGTEENINKDYRQSVRAVKTLDNFLDSAQAKDVNLNKKNTKKKLPQNKATTITNKLMKGFTISPLEGKKNHFILQKIKRSGVLHFTGLITKCKNINEAIEIFNDHIPLLKGKILPGQIMIKKST
jgi:hypothetical protein